LEDEKGRVEKKGRVLRAKRRKSGLRKKRTESSRGAEGSRKGKDRSSQEAEKDAQDLLLLREGERDSCRVAGSEKRGTLKTYMWQFL